jgi:hypothetical protein
VRIRILIPILTLDIPESFPNSSGDRFLDDELQTWHDKVADTVVVET